MYIGMKSHYTRTERRGEKKGGKEGGKRRKVYGSLIW
jgi:hypothetical protein